MRLQEYMNQVLDPDLIPVLQRDAVGTGFTNALAALIEQLDKAIAYMPLPNDYDQPALLKYQASIRDLMKTRDAYKEVLDFLFVDRKPLNIVNL